MSNTDEESQRVQEQKEKVAAMRNAQSNMSAALERITRLEQRLEITADQLERAAKQIHGYTYNSTKSLKDFYMEYVAQARSIL